MESNQSAASAKYDAEVVRRDGRYSGEKNANSTKSVEKSVEINSWCERNDVAIKELLVTIESLASRLVPVMHSVPEGLGKDKASVECSTPLGHVLGRQNELLRDAYLNLRALMDRLEI